jgi:MYND finger
MFQTPFTSPAYLMHVLIYPIMQGGETLARHLYAILMASAKYVQSNSTFEPLETLKGIRARVTSPAFWAEVQEIGGVHDVLTAVSQAGRSYFERTGATLGPEYMESLEHFRAVHQRCANPKCVNLAGFSERRIKAKKCGACKVCGYCSTTCQMAHWKGGHQQMCAGVKRAAENRAATLGG